MRRTAKDELREKLAADVAEWEAQGNEIHQVDVTETRWYRDLVKRRPGLPVMTIKTTDGNVQIWQLRERR